MMEIVIKIPEDSYKATCVGCMLPPDVENVVQAIKNGTPLPKGHGKLVDISKIDEDRTDDNNPIIYYMTNGEYIEAVSLDYINNLPTIIEAEDKLPRPRDCKTCIHSDKENCAGTEGCHKCMWESKYEPSYNSGITIEEAISAFESWIERDKKMKYADRFENIEIYNMAIKALKQQPCKDCVSREAVLMELGKYLCGVPYEKGIDEVIKELPTVAPQLKIGKWMEFCYQNLVCSNCGYVVADTDIDGYKYCPKCGAEMSGGRMRDEKDSFIFN
jgi:predicted Zn-ribbon and HTH transcriptional regulator